MQLSQVVPWGRNFNEYCAMFNLTDRDLNKNILGCGDGPASFNAELTRRGGQIISVDPIYAFDQADLKNRIALAYNDVLAHVNAHQDQFNWTQFESPEQLGKCRIAAMQDFLKDYPNGRSQSRYLAQALPDLTFTDQYFDLALCSHFLFLYTAHFDLDFHRRSIKNLLRVSNEIRIYPLLDLSGTPSPFVDTLLHELEQENHMVELHKVKYEFQKGATSMLVITSP